MAEIASTLATWRVGGQIDESALTGISQYADIVVVATLVGAGGQNVLDPTNGAHVLRGPYRTVIGGVAGSATNEPSADGNATLAGRLWWTEPLKATGAVLPVDALQPSGLAWQINVSTTTRRGRNHTLASFNVNIEGDRDYATESETILVPSGLAGADEAAIGITFLTTPPATVANSTFEGRVLEVLSDNSITGTPELPIAGTTGQALVKNSNTNYDVEWATIAAGGTLPPGYIDGGDFIDPAKFALWNGSNGHVSMADGDSTADFQALFDHVASLALAGLGGGVTVLVPRGRYLVTGSILIPDMTSTFQMVVDMTGVFVLHKPQGGVGNSLFRTGLPAGPLSAEAANDVRNLWTFRGGYFDGDSLPGQIAFEWNAVSRLVMERMHIQSFEIGIRGRFMLHFLLRDCTIHNNKLYQVHIAASGASDAWTGATPSNAASNGTIIQNVRFFGVATQIAQVRISHS
jgi:hypothetical protein